MAISNPPPIARPLTAAMTGLFNTQFSVSPVKPPNPYSSASHQLSSCISPSFKALRSQPAEKIFSPPPVSIAQRKSLSSWSCLKAAASAWDVGTSMALTFPRSNVTSNICPSRRVFTPSDIKGLPFGIRE